MKLHQFTYGFLFLLLITVVCLGNSINGRNIVNQKVIVEFSQNLVTSIELDDNFKLINSATITEHSSKPKSLLIAESQNILGITAAPRSQWYWDSYRLQV